MSTIKLFIIFIIAFFRFGIGYCQVNKKPIDWIYEYSSNYEVGDTIIIKYFANLDKDWYIYSFDSDTIDYVEPAIFLLKSNNSFIPIGSIEYSKSSYIYDEDLKKEIKVFKNSFFILQKIIVLEKTLSLHTTIDYFLIHKVNDESGEVMHLQETF